MSLLNDPADQPSQSPSLDDRFPADDTGGDLVGGAADEAPAMLLSEEQLVVDTELVETGRVRLVKRVEVETVTRTFELRREVLEILRVDSADTDGAARADTDASAATIDAGLLAPGSLQEGSVEIVLMQEEAVVSTQLVPRERVRLTKVLVTEPHCVDAELRSERPELEGREPQA